MRRTARWVLPAFAIALIAGVSGCHSRFVEATLDNRSSHPLHNVEIDYPSAGFGTSTVAANSSYHYRFKILGSGSVKLSFEDVSGKTHSFSGPELDEGQEGSLHITVDDAGHVDWAPDLKTPQ